MTNSHAPIEMMILIDEWLWDGLENIRYSQVTPMQDRNKVLAEAKASGYDVVVEWIENVDERIYQKLIANGPILVDNQWMLVVGDLRNLQLDHPKSANANS